MRIKKAEGKTASKKVEEKIVNPRSNDQGKDQAPQSKEEAIKRFCLEGVPSVHLKKEQRESIMRHTTRCPKVAMETGKIYSTGTRACIEANNKKYQGNNSQIVQKKIQQQTGTNYKHALAPTTLKMQQNTRLQQYGPILPTHSYNHEAYHHWGNYSPINKSIEKMQKKSMG
jgi:hypothetical protein